MKLSSKVKVEFVIPGQGPSGQLGSATLVVLIFLFAMVTFLTASSTTLYHLKRELHRVEARQRLRYLAPPTNAAPTSAQLSKRLTPNGE